MGFNHQALDLCHSIVLGGFKTNAFTFSIPVTNTSVNPARSTGVAIYVGGWAISQLWLFWVAPLIGGVLGGLVYSLLYGNDE
jgi:aquaporin Z